MLYWSLMLFFLAPSVALLIVVFIPASSRKILTVRFPQTRHLPAGYLTKALRRLLARSVLAVRRIRRARFVERNWQSRILKLTICAMPIVAALISMGFYRVYFDRSDLPDKEAFFRFEFPPIGTVYDANGQPLIELAKEHRKIIRYEDIPPVVRDAVIAAEDKNFFSHSGVDYSVMPRVLGKIRFRAIVARLIGFGRRDEDDLRCRCRRG